MASKRDQLQSYQFLVQRMVSALVARESDPEHPPFRRTRPAGIGSVGITALALAITYVVGMIFPGGNDSWRSGDAVIVEKETGTRYVYLAGRLHPATNYASALLAVDRDDEVVQVSRNSLRGVPRGPLIGIRDAPDALPDRKRLLTGGWTMCSQPSTDEAGAKTTDSVLMVGHRPPLGAAVGDAGMLVQVGKDGDQYLVWRGYRHQVEHADEQVAGIAMGGEPWARVDETFVDVLPAGEPVAGIRQSDMGRKSRAVPDRPDTRVGQLLVMRTAGDVEQHYLAEADVLRPISAFQFEIQRSMPETKKAYGGKPPYPIELDPAEASGASRLPVDHTEEPSALPTSKPRFAAPRDAESSVCATFAPGADAPDLMVDPLMPAKDDLSVTHKSSSSRTKLADRVIVPPGYAAVVEATAADTTPLGTVSVVTDMGRAYPLADPELLKTLGYGGVRPVRMPAVLVARLPFGSGLDPKAALRQP